MVNFCLLGGDSETAFRCRRREGEKTDSSPSGEAVDGSDLHLVKQKTRPGDRPRGTDTTKIENKIKKTVIAIATNIYMVCDEINDHFPKREGHI